MTIRSLRFARRFQLATTVALLAFARPGFAQTSGLALDRFDPAPAGDRMFGVPSPYAAGPHTPHVMLLGDYAHNPLVLRSEPSGKQVGAVVGNQLFLNLDVGLSLWNRLMLDVDAPLALAQNGDSPSGGGQAFSSPSSVQFGDLRFGARLRLIGEYHDPFQIAVGGYVWAPTGAKNSFVSSGQARGLPQLILGGRVDERIVWSAAAGPELQRSSTFANTDQGSMFKWGAGFGVLLLDNRHLQIGPEINGGVTLRDVQKRTTNAELLFDARYRIVDDVEIAAGAGPGLTTGIGTPDFRAVFSLAYTPEQKLAKPPPPPPPEPVDPCADKSKEGCGPPPPKDTDGDGIVDPDDACPEVKGVKTDDPKTNGCPADRDGDGIIDGEDACPDEKGVADPDPQKNGCPPPKDTDSDGIMDPQDACPNEKGAPDPDPQKNGCPKSVRVSETEILILEQVQFDTGKAVIKKASDPLLDEVADVLKEHPEITQLEVQGHTDDRGRSANNDVLSQARANAVMKAMIKRGIAPERLTAKGYGQNRPLVENTSEEGRQKNRRVQFVILAKQPKETH
jgi:outer membrane protein OmpA-like peptidoglycan-associated protein